MKRINLITCPLGTHAPIRRLASLIAVAMLVIGCIPGLQGADIGDIETKGAEILVDWNLQEVKFYAELYRQVKEQGADLVTNLQLGGQRAIGNIATLTNTFPALSKTVADHRGYREAAAKTKPEPLAESNRDAESSVESRILQRLVDLKQTKPTTNALDDAAYLVLCQLLRRLETLRMMEPNVAEKQTNKAAQRVYKELDASFVMLRDTVRSLPDSWPVKKQILDDKDYQFSEQLRKEQRNSTK